MPCTNRTGFLSNLAAARAPAGCAANARSAAQAIATTVRRRAKAFISPPTGAVLEAGRMDATETDVVARRLSGATWTVQPRAGDVVSLGVVLRQQERPRQPAPGRAVNAPRRSISRRTPASRRRAAAFETAAPAILGVALAVAALVQLLPAGGGASGPRSPDRRGTRARAGKMRAHERPRPARQALLHHRRRQRD